MSLTRRELLRASGSTAVALLAADWMRPLRAAAAGREPVLVTVFLRGGADALNLVVPYRDPDYYALRPTLGIPAGDVLPLDGRFGLHPDLGALHGLYRAGRLAIVHACGSPLLTRSHFQAQDAIEFGAPGNTSVTTGWLNRYAVAAGLDVPWSGVTLGAAPATALTGSATTLAFPSLAEFQYPAGFASGWTDALGRLGTRAGGPYGRSVHNVLESIDVLARVDRRPYATWPATTIASSLRDVAALIRAQIGLRVAAVDMDGWDLHTDAQWRLPKLARELSAALSAFAVDLGSDFDRTVVLVMSEFGRRAAENGSGGSDHGRAGMMLALGAAIRGGRVLLRNGSWPGLGPSQLTEGLDLAVTTDFRDVFAEILRAHMALPSTSAVLPNYASRYVGLFG